MIRRLTYPLPSRASVGPQNEQTLVSSPAFLASCKSMPWRQGWHKPRFTFSSAPWNEPDILLALLGGGWFDLPFTDFATPEARTFARQSAAVLHLLEVYSAPSA